MDLTYAKVQRTKKGRPPKSEQKPALTINFPKLEPWQQDAFDDFTAGTYSIQTISAKRQIGKSVYCSVSALYTAFHKPNSISVIIEPTLAQGRRIFKSILKSIGGESAEVLKSANATLLEMEFINGSSIICKSADQKDNLRGITVTGVLVIDEGAFIQDSIYEILYPTVDANSSPIIIVSTPLFMSGEFYNKYLEGLRPNPVSKTYDWSEYDTSKYLPPEKLEYYRERLSPLRFRSEYEGKFIAEGSLAMGDISHIIKDYSRQPAAFAGLDWGLGGENDFTVLILLDENASVTAIHSVTNLSPTQQVDWLAAILNSEHSLRSIEVEINSIGTVYLDFLRKRTSKYIQEFYTSNEEKRRIIEQLISAIANNKITIPDDPELKKQLQHYDMQKTKTGYTYNGVGAHDDYVMALAFAYDAYLNGGGGFEITFA